mmetsp:Transcript_32143/g.83723  ORF Transcript_32143/g.83723 Transcript_32143/m.83723 type:complete len:422 (+) Transcript_32143:144-1409(+)
MVSTSGQKVESSQPSSCRPNAVLLGWLGMASVVLALISRYAHASPHSGASMSSTMKAREANAPKPWELPFTEPLVIAHRGASTDMPELAPEAYKLAIEQGADSIECDVLLTKDLHGICRHNPELDLSTNVRDMFGDRLTTKIIDGHNITGVFASDLTLAEVKQLRLVQPLPFRDQQYNGKFQVATMEEFLQIALDAPRTVAVHLEVKHPRYHNSLPQVKAAKTSIEKIVLDAMKQRGFTGPINSPQWLQRPSYLLCFDGSWLKKVAKMGSCIPRLLLLKGNINEISPDGRSIPDLMSKPSLDDLAKYVDIIGPGKGLLVRPVAAPNGTAEKARTPVYQSTQLAEMLYSRGFQVHVYTFREEDVYRFPGLSVNQEVDLLYKKLGVEGVISDSIAPLASYLEHQNKHQWNMGLASAPARRPCP